MYSTGKLTRMIQRQRLLFLWLSAVAFVLPSFDNLIPLQVLPSPTPLPSIAMYNSNDHHLNISYQDHLADKGGFPYRQHFKPEKPKAYCRILMWMATISMACNQFKASLVLTVDLNECGDFSSVQKPVDAIPDCSSTRTLVLNGSGVYWLVI